MGDFEKASNSDASLNGIAFHSGRGCDHTCCSAATDIFAKVPRRGVCDLGVRGIDDFSTL